MSDHDAPSTSAGLVERVHRRLLAGAGHEPFGDAGTAEQVRAWVREESPLLPAPEQAAAVAAVLARVRGLGPLDPLLADGSVTEVMVNGDGRVWAERAGTIVDTGTLVDHGTSRRLIERIVAPLGLRVDRSSPMVDARLPDGSRVNAVVPPLAIDGPCITIRRFGAREVPLEEFAAPAVVELLRRAVAERRNVVVSGGTGAGKTTLLNALAAELDPRERVVTIEDAAELRLPGEHVVRLESRPATAEGLGAVSTRDLVRNALRMRPDRIVVGEVRGGEAFDMVQAMNTGHEGCLSTCHANTPDDAVRRLETLSMLAGAELPLAAVREQLVAAVDLVVQVARRAAGRRVVVAIGEPVAVDGATRCRPLVDGGRVMAAPQLRPRTSPIGRGG